jgi:Zn-dependent protease with chaperone function
VECVRFRRASLVLLLFLLTMSSAAVGKRNKPKLAENIDLPPTFDIDFKLGALQRGQVNSQVSQVVPDDAAGRVGADVFQSLIRMQMISGIGLPYAWTFKLYDAPVVNAYSIPDGEIVAYTGISRLLGSNRGLWAAVLAHEMAHVARRHAVRKYLFHEYIEEQVRYWQLRAQLGDKYAGWTALAVRVAGKLAEKKLSRDLESDADKQGMLLMVRAGYHPDYVFAMHHLLRINSGEQSKVGTFFFSDHPRWETRDQRTERAYTEALAEYSHLWPDPDASPGGPPPAVAFLGKVRGVENKAAGTGDLTLALTCRNVGRPIDLVIHLTTSNGTAIPTTSPDYRDSTGALAIREHASCSDTDNAGPTIVHIPTAVIPEHDRKLRAQVDLLGPTSEVLEHSTIFDVHFPKINNKSGATVAKVWVEPRLSEMPGTAQTGQYESAKALVPNVVSDKHSEVVTAALPATVQADKPTVDVAATVASIDAPLPKVTTSVASTSPSSERLGVLPFAVDDSGRQSHWGNSLAPLGSGTWWELGSSVESALKISFSRAAVFFPTRPTDTVSPPTIIVITNGGSSALTLPSLAVAGTDASDFPEVNDCGHSIEPRATCTVSVFFRPTGNGTRTATLIIKGEAQKVELSGIGK